MPKKQTNNSVILPSWAQKSFIFVILGFLVLSLGFSVFTSFQFTDLEGGLNNFAYALASNLLPLIVVFSSTYILIDKKKPNLQRFFWGTFFYVIGAQICLLFEFVGSISYTKLTSTFGVDHLPWFWLFPNILGCAFLILLAYLYRKEIKSL